MSWFYSILGSSTNFKVFPSFFIILLLLIPTPAISVLLVECFSPETSSVLSSISQHFLQMIICVKRETSGRRKHWQVLQLPLRKLDNFSCTNFLGLTESHKGFVGGSFVGLHVIVIKLRETSSYQGGSEKQRHQTLHFPLLTLIRFLSHYFSSLSRSLWIVAQTPGVSASPPSFVSAADLLRVNSCSIIQG